MLGTLRSTLHRALVTPRGDALAPVRLSKDLARRLNVTLGEPLCSAETLERRRIARARLVELRHAPRPSAPSESLPAVLAPVKVYVEGDRNARELTRIREVLDAKAIAYDVLDVAGDEATLDFVVREAKCEKDELPVVFIGTSAIGGFRELVDADLSGALRRPG